MGQVYVFRVSSSYFVAGGEVISKYVTKAAPIIKYMKGWSVKQLEEYCSRKKWELEWMQDEMEK